MPPSSVLINSIPKSGTYLLTQLVSALGAYPKAGDLHFNDQHYTTGTDANGALQVIKTPSPKHLQVLPAGHCAPAHLTWSLALEEALREQNIAMFFMYRDPRDVVIAYTKYAMYSDIYKKATEAHRQYYEFLCSLPSDQRRTEHVLTHRLFLFQFMENAPWLLSKACLPISFEALYRDIMGLAEGKTGDVISQVMRLMNISALPCPPEALFEQVHGKSKTAMGKRPSNHEEFFDEGLRQAAQGADFRAAMHMYGYD